jgi:hypothetical protein
MILVWLGLTACPATRQLDYDTGFSISSTAKATEFQGGIGTANLRWRAIQILTGAYRSNGVSLQGAWNMEQ